MTAAAPTPETQLARQVAEQIGLPRNRLVHPWVQNHKVDSGNERIPKLPVRGYVKEIAEEPGIYFAIKKPKCKFTAAHEMGHLDQLLRRSKEGRPFTRALYQQELEASEFGMPGIQADKSIPIFFRCRSYHHILAMQAAFPVVFHLIYTLTLFFATRILLRLIGIC